jgi:hypothetical protein
MIDPSIVFGIWVRPGVTALPVGGAMALCTIGSKHTAMEGRLGVTCGTVRRRAFKDAVLVALTAIYIDMSARQFECREIMVKGRRIPVVGGVA